MNKISPSSTDRNDYKEPWYKKAIVNVAVIGGLAFGIKKMKGPYAKLLSSIQSNTIQKAAQKEADKISANRLDINPDDIDFNVILKGRTSKTPLEQKALVPSSSDLIQDVEGIENEILEVGEKVINPTPSLNAYNLIGNNQAENITRRTRYFSRLRYETLIEHLSRENLLLDDKGNPRFSYDEVDSAKGNDDALREIHEYYMNNSSDYAELYRRRAKRLISDFRANIKGRILQTTNQFQDFLYTGSFDDTLRSQIELRTTASNQIDKATDLMKEYRDGILDQDRRYLSASQNFVKTGDKLFDQVGEFDYTGYLKDLCATVSKLRSDPYSSIQDASVFMEYRGSASYVTVSFSMKNKKGTHKISIPLSRDGKMPTKGPSSTPRWDALFVHGDEYGLSPKQAIITNKSQDLLRRVTERLDSSFLNLLESNPHKAVKSLQRMISGELMSLALVEGETRDIGKALAFHNDYLTGLVKSDPNDNLTLKAYSRSALEAATNMHRLSQAKKSGRRVVGIGFDIETLGMADLGPSAQIRDPHTQVHSVGISEILFGKDGNVVTNSQQYTSDHVIDYLKKNDGWVDGPEGNINWLRRLMKMPQSQDNTPDKVISAFADFLKKESSSPSNASFRSNSNYEFIRKVINELITRIENYTQDGSTDVFLITKNGTMFDLRILNMIAPNEFARLKKIAPHIDTHSIAHWRKNSTYGRGSLALNRLISSMLHQEGFGGRYDDYDIETPSGLRNAFRAFSTRNKRGSSLLDFAYEVDRRMSSLHGEAHMRPEVDNIGSFALLSKWISDLEGGASHFSLDHLGRFGRLVGMSDRPLTITEDREILDMLSAPSTVYGHVASASFATSNMLAKGILSAVDLSQMMAFPDVPRNKDWHQLFRGHMNFKPSKTAHDRLMAGALKPSQLVSMFESPLQTTTHHTAEAFMVGAQDRTNQYAKQVHFRTFLTFGHYAGREGMTVLSKEQAELVELNRLDYIPLNDYSFDSMPVIANDLRMYRERVYRRARRIAAVRNKTMGARPTTQDYIDAGNDISRMKPIELAVPGATLSKGDFGVKTIKAEIGGKIIGVEVEENALDPSSAPIIKAKIQKLATLDKTKGGTARGLASKSSFSVADNMVYGAHAFAHFDAFAKGYSGAFKGALLMTAIDNLRKQVIDGGPHAAAARAKLKELAGELGATWTGTTMLQPTRGPSVVRSKNARNLADQTAIDRWLGTSNVSFIDAINWIRKSGQAWESDEELANGYYRFIVGKKSTAAETISAGRSALDTLITQKYNQACEDFDKATEQGLEGYKHLRKEDFPKIKQDILTFLQTIYLPKTGGARLLEFRNSNGGVSDPNWETHVMGMDLLQPLSLSDIDQGKGLRPGSVKIRPSHFTAISSEGTTLSPSTLSFIQGRQRKKYIESYKKAEIRLRRFKDILLSRATTSGMELKLEDIKELLDRNDTIDLANHPLREISDYGEDQLKALLKERIDFSGLSDEQIEIKTSQIIDDIRFRKIGKSLADNTRWMSTSQAQRMVQIAKKHGDFISSVGIEGGLEIDLQQVLRMTDMRDPLKQKDMDGVVHVFEKALEAQGGKPGIVRQVINRTTEDGTLEQKVILDKLVFPTFGDMELISDRITPRLRYASNHTAMFTQIMTHMSRLDTAMKSGTHTEEYIRAERQTLGKKYIQLLTRSFNLHHNSLFGGGDVYEVPGIRAPVRGADALIARARELKQNGFYRNKPGMEQYDSVLDKIIESKANTVFFASSALDTFSVTSEPGKQISFARHLDAALGKDKNGQEIVQKIKGGLMQIPLGYTRDPLDQPLTDAVVDMFGQAIPDEMMRHLHSDSNAIYNTFISELQRTDYDGDQATVFTVLFNSIDEMNDMIRERHERLPKLMARLDVQMRNTKRPLGFTSDGKVIMGHYNNLGEFIEDRLEGQTDSTTSAMLGLIDQSIGIAKSISINNPSIMTPQYAKAQLDVANYNAIMKTQIGVVTNLIGRKAHHLMQVGATKNPRMVNDLLGNISFGLAHVNQKAMEIGKRGQEAFIATLTSITSSLQNPNRRTIEGENALISIFEGAFRNVAKGTDTPDLYEGQNISDYSRNLARLIYNNEEARQQALGGDGITKMQLEARDDYYLGKNRTLISDTLLDLDDNIKRAQYESLLKLGSVDIVDLHPRPSVLEELGTRLNKKFNISDLPLKKTGKYAAVGAAIFLASNFFRPTQLSESANPLDMFVDLGGTIDGDHARISYPLQLDRRLPLDMVNASFSKEAFIETQMKPKNKKDKMSSVIKSLIGGELTSMPSYRSFEDGTNNTYTNYTSNISYFGSANLQRRSKL